MLSSAWYLIRPYLETRSRIRAGVIVVVSIALVIAGATPVRVLMVAAVVSCLLPVTEQPR